MRRASSASAAASKARSRRRITADQAASAPRVGGDVPRHPRPATTSSSRCSGTASTTRRSSTAAWRRSRATSACRWSRRTTSTTCVTATTCRTTSCCASARARSVNDAERLRYHGDQFYLKTGDEMAACSARSSRRRISNTVRIADRCDVDLSGTENHLPNFDVPAGLHARRLLRARRARRASPSAWRGCGSSRRRDRCGIRSRSTSSASRTRSR